MSICLRITSCGDTTNVNHPVIEGTCGGFHQPVSAMLGASPGSPFRAGAGHRAPWPPPSPAHHASAPQPQD
ncbi:Uncharacterized protein GBIM_11422, partial [Gryllus bimaculatus]